MLLTYSSTYSPPSIYLQKGTVLQETKKYDKKSKTRYIKTKVLKLAGQGSPVGGGIPRRDKRVSDTLLPLLEVPQKHQPNAHNTYTEYLVQIHVGFALASSVSVSPYESCIVNSVENLSSPIL